MNRIANLTAVTSLFAMAACGDLETSNSRVVYDGPHGECATLENCQDKGMRIEVDQDGQVGAISGIAIVEP